MRLPGIAASASATLTVMRRRRMPASIVGDVNALVGSLPGTIIVFWPETCKRFAIAIEAGLVTSSGSIDGLGLGLGDGLKLWLGDGLGLGYADGLGDCDGDMDWLGDGLKLWLRLGDGDDDADIDGDKLIENDRLGDWLGDRLADIDWLKL